MATSSQDFDSLVREMKGGSSARASLLLFVIMGLLVAVFAWAAVTEIDDVTRGDGRVVPSSDIQVVQAAEQGVLQEIFVAEGDIVEQGEVILRLDRTLLSSQFDQENQRAAGLRARILRLEAEVNGAEELNFPDDLTRQTPDVVRTEAALFVARTEEMQSEIDVLETQRVQRQTELEEGRVERTASQRSLALIREEIAIIEPLVQRRIEPETSLLTLRRALAEAESRATQAATAISRFEAALREIDDRITSTERRFRAQAQSELAITTAELTELETRIPALAERANRAELRAPVRGVVNKVHVASIGSVAQAGATLVEIVPVDDTLLVEAYLRPGDIAFIRPDQEVKIKITAYDFSRYGSIDGQITRIGSDTIPHPQTDEQVFVVDVRANTNILDGAGEAVEIIPGMVAQIDILAGRKTVLDYVTEPVVRVRETAFRD